MPVITDIALNARSNARYHYSEAEWLEQVSIETACETERKVTRKASTMHRKAGDAYMVACAGAYFFDRHKRLEAKLTRAKAFSALAKNATAALKKFGVLR